MPVGLGGEQGWWCPTLDDSPDDISGNGNNGTYQGGMGTVADTGSGGTRAYSLDGTNDYIDLNIGWNFSGPYSYSYWIKKDPKKNVQVIGNRDSSSDGWLNYIGSSNNLVSYNDVTYTSASALILTNAVWTSVAVTFDGSTLGIYKNGVLSSSVASGQQTVSTINATIGRYHSGIYYDGIIDDARIFERSLTQAEITHLATARGVLGGPGSDGYNAFTSAIYNPRNYNNTRFG